MTQAASKVAQTVTAVTSGAVFAFSTAVIYVVPCLLVIVLDVISAFFLNRRLAKKYPGHADGKFKSEKLIPMLLQFVLVFVLLMLAHYCDELVLRNHEDMFCVRYVSGAYLIYQIWSVLENWATENDSPVARVLQKIMISKAERHLNVDLTELKEGMSKDKEDKEGKDDTGV